MNDYHDLHHIIHRVVRSFLTGDERPSSRPVRLAQAPSSRHPSAAERRVQVARCRALRSEIASFEADFRRTTRLERAPRSSTERSPIAHVYEEYRGLKQAIRDDAARHIQAVFRGHCVRSSSSSSSAVLGARLGSLTRTAAGAGAGAGAGGVALGGPRGDRPSVAVGALPSAAAVQLANLRDEKASLKRELRAFDVQFAERHGGRAPGKAEKEHLRPKYTRYHALKGLISECEGSSGGGEGRTPGSSDKPPTASSSATASAAAAAAAAAARSSVARRLSLGESSSASGAASAGELSDMGSGKEEEEGEVGMGSEAPGGAAGSSSSSSEDAALQAEKRALQALLRAFEREFEAAHGRKVKFVKDIESVKDKYARYKVLKGMVSGSRR